jgi:dCTP deaminase
LVDSSVDYKLVTEAVTIKDNYILKSGELIMGITREKITLPEDIAGFLNSRSRYARIGLMSHITAPFISPGISNQQVLEIYNAGPRPLKLIPGTKICQMTFIYCKGRAKYEGLFKDQNIQ